MKKLAIVGKGNVGSHLYHAFKLKHYPVCNIDSHTLEGLNQDTEIIILAVSDKAIPDVARQVSCKIPEFKGICVHTAGSVDINAIAPFFNKFGVFYPMQTFSKGHKMVRYDNIPVFIEGSEDSISKDLEQLALEISDKVSVITSRERALLHLAAVFACNFTNACYSMANDVLKNAGLPFEVLFPLISQTAEKVMQVNNPDEVQTGPAVRKDLEVMKSQLEMLHGNEKLKKIYSIISDYIIER